MILLHAFKKHPGLFSGIFMATVLKLFLDTVYFLDTEILMKKFLYKALLSPVFLVILPMSVFETVGHVREIRLGTASLISQKS